MQHQDTAQIEAKLREIWSEVLETSPQRIPTDRSFFTLGGDSILLMQVMERVNSLFFGDSPDAALSPMDFFTFGTIRELTNRLSARASMAPAPASRHHGFVAIIGMAIHVPGAATPEAFWRNVREGRETLRFFSDAELLGGGATAQELTDPRYVRCAGLIEQVQLIDADYFGLSPAEAALMAPEQRLLLESAHEALESAGYGVRWSGERVGVFAGFGLSTYLLDHFAVSSRGLESASGMRLLLGNTSPATRISYLLNLTGPSITLDTACSSSLVAVHQACRAILNGECEMALAGGATVRRFAPRGYHAEKGGIFSPDGHCRPFDRQAQGTVSSSGGGMVLLKSLETAIAHGDSVWAVIRGTAINNDGGEKVGYTAPSTTGQAAVIRAACAAAGVEPRSLQYIETHGTATELGDAIEMAALNSAFGAGAEPASCALGTLKANLGHLEAAAGVAGLIKVALALQNREMPPAIHFHEPNPRIDFGQTPFRVNSQPERWSPSLPRRAGVSSFGIGGTNAHAVLEEAPQVQSGASHRDSQLLIVSARSTSALRSFSRQLATELSGKPQLRLSDVAYTLQVGRAAHAHRRYCVCNREFDAVRLLEADVDPIASVPLAASEVPVVFMFPGQGSQHVQMARGIYATEPIFRQHFDACVELLQPTLGMDLRKIIYPTQSRDDHAGAAACLSDTAVCQPALFAVEYSLARLWQSWGVVPTAMIGHSVGEYVAACISGVLSLEDALALVATRGSLMRRAPAGRMLAVALSRDEVLPLLGAVDLAAVNADESCVLAGTLAELERLKQELDARGVVCSLLDTSHAFHSSLMDAVLQEFGTVLEGVAMREVRIPYASNVTGDLFREGARIPPQYWVRHLRGTVEFALGVQRLMQGSAKVFVELGPGTALSSCVRNIDGSSRHTIVNSCRHHRAGDDDAAVLMRAVGRAWQVGCSIDWHRFNASNAAHRVALPTYPFERMRHWVDGPTRATVTHAMNESPSRVPDVASDSPEPHRAGSRFYVPAWKQRATLVNTRDRMLSTCLLFDDDTPICEALAHALASRCADVVRVSAGSSYAETERGFTLDPAEPSHYSNLMNALAAAGRELESIVHAWQINPPEREAWDSEAALSMGFYSLLYLCQSLEARHRSRPLELTVLTIDAQVILGDECGNPLAAMLAACGRVIARELPNIICRCVDLPLCACSPTQVAGMADMVISEALGPSREPLVAYRGRSFFVPTYEELPAVSEAVSRPLQRAGGVYLITGGLGGIGLTLAEFLARSAAAGIVLTGRSELPPRQQWDGWLAVHPQDPVSACIRKILAIESYGAEVFVLRADVTQLEQMGAAVSQTLERFGALHGVIHAAGVPGAGVIALKSYGTAQRVLAPKIRGTLVLLHAVRGLDLDFFVVCSSIASILTPSGQFDYCAANAFLDAFAHVHDREGRTRFISINWDGWTEVGMAVRATASTAPTPSQFQRGLSCHDGAEAFRQILSFPRPQWVVACELAPDASVVGQAGAVDRMEEELRAAAGPQDAEERREPSYTSRTAEQVLAQIWRELLGVYEPGPDDDFFALGGDSLLAIQLAAQVESCFGVNVSVRQLVETPTFAGLATLLRNATTTGDASAVGQGAELA